MKYAIYNLTQDLYGPWFNEDMLWLLEDWFTHWKPKVNPEDQHVIVSSTEFD